MIALATAPIGVPDVGVARFLAAAIISAALIGFGRGCAGGCQTGSVGDAKFEYLGVLRGVYPESPGFRAQTRRRVSVDIATTGVEACAGSGHSSGSAASKLRSDIDIAAASPTGRLLPGGGDFLTTRLEQRVHPNGFDSRERR